MNFLDWLKNEENLRILRSIQSFITMFALIIGGFWAYFLFVKRRQRYPRANITQQIWHSPLPNNKVLLRATIRICNEGEILLPLVSVFSRVQQMIPCSDNLCEGLKEQDDSNEQCEPEAEWPLLSERKLKFEKGEREIEPGETDELHFDFIIDSAVQVIVVYSYVKNVKKRRLGWNATSIYDLRRSSRTRSDVL